METAYWEYVDLVTAVVRRSSAGSNALDYHEQLDIVQETFLRAFEEKARLAFDGIRDYRPYLLTICRNVIVNAFRHRGREVPAAINTEDLEVLVSAGDSEEPWADPDTVAVVEKYIQSLNPVLRRLYEIRYVKCQSQIHTATTMRLSRQKVRTLEKRLRKGLESALKKAKVV